MEEIKNQCDVTRRVFHANIESVKELINFDKLLLNTTILSLENLVDDLKRVKGIMAPHLTAEGTLKQLKNIKENKSLEIHYQKIYNSCLVLLVSYFTSAVSEIFRECVKVVVLNRDRQDIEKEEIKLSLGELKAMNFNLSESIGTLIINKNDFSFQDMQSISKAFKTYFGVEIEKNDKTNDIILAHACRHIIVHTDGRVNEKTIRMTKHAFPRAVKSVLTDGEIVQFTPEDLDAVAASMKEYLASLAAKLSAV